MSADRQVQLARLEARRIVRTGLRKVAPEAVAQVEREDRERTLEAFRAVGLAFVRLAENVCTITDALGGAR